MQFCTLFFNKFKDFYEFLNRFIQGRTGGNRCLSLGDGKKKVGYFKINFEIKFILYFVDDINLFFSNTI